MMPAVLHPYKAWVGSSATRTITPVTEKEVLVEVIIKKGDIRGFGKLQETIPQGFTAMEKNSSEAIFTAQDRIAKFVWLNLPSASEKSRSCTSCARTNIQKVNTASMVSSGTC